MNIIPKKYRQIVLAIAAFLIFDLDSVVTSYIIMEYSEQTLYLNARLHSST